MTTDQKPSLPATRDARTSPALSTLLTSAIAEDAVERIASSSALLGEARQQLPLLRAKARAAASPTDVRAVIGRRLATFPQADMSDGEWAAWWADYTDALAGLSTEAIEAGLKAWVARPDARFLPKPGELRAIATASVTETARALNVLARATERAAELEALARRARSNSEPEDFQLEAVHIKRFPKMPEDREAVRTMAAGFTTDQARRLAERPRPVIRATHGDLAPGHHVTAESLALMHGESRAQTEERLRREASEMPHPVDVLVGIMESAGLGDQLDPALIEEARAICDEEVVLEPW
jgi:hypothetical protein